MPKQKDLKRIVRSRMQKTGESYTAARLQVIKKKDVDYAKLAGMSEAAIRKATDRSWAEWVKQLDEAGATSKPHSEIAKHVSSLGTPDWWSQMITVGYERIRGLRERGQRRAGLYEASKSRTFSVPVDKLYKAFADPRKRGRWLPVKLEVRTANRNKTMRLTWDDGTRVQLGFLSKSETKSAVAIQHERLPNKSAAEKMKSFWAERLAALAEIIE